VTGQRGGTSLLGLEGLLRPQTSRGQEAQRRDHLPRTPPLRHHPRDAPRPWALPGLGHADSRRDRSARGL